MTQYQEAVFTVRLDGEDVKQLTVTDINKLNEDLAAKGVDKLVKIKRSNGDVEYVSKAVLKQLENDRARRRNQEKLAQMRESGGQQQKQPNRFTRALKELFK